MKSINRSLPIYLDYNATAPWSHSVHEWLGKGAVPFGNASSQHQFGKQARRAIRETTDYLFEFFELPSDTFELYYHSGASESINHLFKGFALEYMRQKKSASIVFFKTDHSCVVNQRQSLQLFGIQVTELEVDSNGSPKDLNWIEHVASIEGPVLLNLMWSHNETGIVWPVVDYAKKLKKLKPNLFIHVDAVQAPGKINCTLKEFAPVIDAITFSGHKFGAFKGVGMTFLRQQSPILSLIDGGGQQNGRRSGTENVSGVYSLQLALRDLGNTKPEFLSNLQKARDTFELMLVQALGEKVEIIGRGTLRNSNTSCMIFSPVRSDVMLTALDLAGLAVSSGSACSSGATIPNRVLMQMGRSREQALNSLRFSFGPHCDLGLAQEIASKCIAVMQRY